MLFGSLAAWLILGRRYQAPWLKVAAALIVFIFLLPYSASIFQGLSYLFQVNFNISYDLALGGYFAGSLTAVLERYPVHVPPAKQPPWYLLASLVFMTSFGTWDLPQMVQKYYAVKDERVIRTATVITTLFALVIVFTAYFNGALAHVFFDVPVLNDAGQPDFDRIIPALLVKTIASTIAMIVPFGVVPLVSSFTPAPAAKTLTEAFANV